MLGAREGWSHMLKTKGSGILSKARVSMASHQTKTDLVYQALRQAIVTGHYPPGSRIIADQLAEELGISKVPVREAIVRLVGEEWLQVKPHVGAIVPELSPDEILETSALRAAVEGLAVRLSAEQSAPATLKQLRALAEQMEHAAEASPGDYPRLNLEFHSLAVQSCPFSSLRSMSTSLAEKVFRLAPVRLLPEYLPESQAQHRDLLAALERRDGEGAERVVRHHIERAGELLWRVAIDQAETARRRMLRPTCLCGNCSSPPER